MLDLLQRHPQRDLPTFDEDLPPPLAVHSDAVLTALKAFPRGTSPGASQLRHQHLLEAVAGSVVPATQTCLDQLTKLMSFILAGKLDSSIAPWLAGAPLTALRKEKGGFRPIAVGDVFRRLASRLCCAAAKSRLPDLLLPYGQVGVGVKGGLEAASHSVRAAIHDHGHREDLCCFKVDMLNAFNECDRSSYLTRLRHDLPDLFSWVSWCYKSTGELRFGDHRILSTAGVQQGDPLGPLLFSLVVLQLLDAIGPTNGLMLHLWYLDDGTFVGTRDAVASFVNSLVEKGPSFGLKLNLKKCEVFWPSGDQTFPDCPSEIHRVCAQTEGAELLGSPVCGSIDFYNDFIARRVDSVLQNQSLLQDLNNPQVEIHLLRSCLGFCKINNLLRTVTPGTADQH